jgi:hypothetical protein
MRIILALKRKADEGEKKHFENKAKNWSGSLQEKPIAGKCMQAEAR